jgi:hypothetical protein
LNINKYHIYQSDIFFFFALLGRLLDFGRADEAVEEVEIRLLLNDADEGSFLVFSSSMLSLKLISVFIGILSLPLSSCKMA